MLTENVTLAISILGETIEKSLHSHLSFHRRNQRIELLEQKNICFLKSGNVSVYRKDNDILTISLQAPAILGMTQMRNSNKFHYLRCNTDCEMWIIDIDNAVRLFNRSNLWNYAFDILTFHLDLYFNRELLITPSTSSGIIIEHIKAIWNMPYEERMNISIYTYIMQRNQISRSIIHKVLARLLDKGVIEMQRGKLLAYRPSTSDPNL